MCYFYICLMKTSHMLSSCRFLFYRLDANKPSKFGSYMLKTCLASWKEPESLNHYLEVSCPAIGTSILDLTWARNKFILYLKHICLDVYVVVSKITLSNTDILRKVVWLIYFSAWVSIEKFRINIVNMALSSFRTEFIF